MFLWGVPRLSSEYLYMYFFFCSDDTYLVVDYCPRNLVQMSELENSEGILPGGKVIPDVNNFLAWLTLLQNNENKTTRHTMFPKLSFPPLTPAPLKERERERQSTSICLQYWYSTR